VTPSFKKAMNFQQKLNHAWQTSASFLTVGLDPDPKRFPRELTGQPYAIFRFCRDIVDATAPYACSFKPQIAYFAANRAEDQLEALCDHIRTRYPTLPIILDAKRGDIGPTAEQYAREAFERYQADCVTVNPYMGRDTIEPYLRWADRGIFVLCRTSNPGGSNLQALTLHNGKPLYLHVASLVAEQWNAQGQCGLVVGATYPAELAAVRRQVGNEIPLLIPGIGAQGGTVSDTIHHARNQAGSGMLITVSRAILYASNGETWRESAAKAAQALRNEINAAAR
jgi:orotidine-5'-phosphate decarboxylase